MNSAVLPPTYTTCIYVQDVGTFPISGECEYKVELLDFYPNTLKSFPIHTYIIYYSCIYYCIRARAKNKGTERFSDSARSPRSVKVSGGGYI